MTGRRPSWALCLYYGFLLFTTALSYGLPYPVFGAVLTGPSATLALVVDCLLLVHIILGVMRAQRLTWYLILAYNLVNLASLLVTLVVLSPVELGVLLGGTEPGPAFYRSVVIAALAMLAATAYVARTRERFSNSNPYLI